MIFKFKGRRLGGHIHAKVFSGNNPDALGKNGDLIFREEEWVRLQLVADIVDEAYRENAAAATGEHRVFVLIEEETPDD